MIKFLIITALFITPIGAKELLTAEDAVQIGLKHNFNIQIARNEKDIAKNNIGLGTAGFLPTLNASANHQVNNIQQETDSPFSFGDSDSRNTTGQISLSWTLFNGFKMFIDKNRYNELAKLGEYQARYNIENTVIQILRAYYNVVQQSLLYDVQKSTLDISKSRLEKEAIKKELGGTSSTDFLNARVSYNNDRANFLNQELQALIAKQELNLLLGRESNFPIEVDTQILIPNLTLKFDDILELAKKNNSNYLILQQNKIVAEKNISLSKSVYSPTLSLNANYGYTYSYTDRLKFGSNSGIPSDIESKSTNKSVNLALTFNLFNGFRDKINYQNARLEAKNQSLALKQYLIDLTGLVKEKLVSYEKRIELITLEEQNILAAEQNLKLLEDLFDVGAASSLEFRDAQVNLARSQSKLISEKYQARLLRAEIDQLAGLLMVE